MADVPSTSASRKRVAAVVVVWMAVMTVVGLGCYGRNCDGSVAIFGRNPGEGRLLRADLWESSPIDGVWLDFPGQRAWIFEINDIGDREPQVINTYISAQADPFHEQGSFTQGGGNLTEISSVQKGRLVVKNGTCADYFVRVVVEVAPFPPPAPAPVIPADADGGADAAIP